MSISLSSPEDMSNWLCDNREPLHATISVAKLAALISKALIMDGLEHDTNAVLRILLESLGDYDEMVHQPDVAITGATVYRNGVDWMVAIAEHLGFNGEEDEVIDLDWLEGRPHMAAVHRAMAMLADRVISAASAVYEAQHGHSMLEVFLASTETGEDFDQSRARLTAQRRGLARVK